MRVDVSEGGDVVLRLPDGKVLGMNARLSENLGLILIQAAVVARERARSRIVRP